MKLVDKLKVGVLATGLAMTSGCASTNGRDDALLGLILMGTGINNNNPAAASVGRGLVDYGSAKAGKSEVNVGSGNTQYKTNSVDRRELIVEYYKDDNRNGKYEINESIGEVNGPINLDNYEIMFYLRSVSMRNVTYSVRDKNGNKIDSTVINPNDKVNWYANLNEFSENSTNNLNGFDKKNSGKFTFYARQDGSHKVFKKEVIITRNPKINYTKKLMPIQ